MPTITLLDNHVPNLLPMKDRTPGVHVSAIIHKVFTSNPLLPGYYKPNDGDFDTTLTELGNAFEDMIALRLHQDDPDDYLRPGELTLDNIHGTPDIYRPSFEAVQEIKFTRESTRRLKDAGLRSDPYKIKPGTTLPENNSPLSGSYARRWWQVKSYCYMMGVTTGLLTVMYILGDYKHRKLFAPTWLCEFEIRELEAHWDVMCKVRDEMMATGEGLEGA